MFKFKFHDNFQDSEELDEEESSLKDSYMVCKPYDQAEVILFIIGNKIGF